MLIPQYLNLGAYQNSDQYRLNRANERLGIGSGTPSKNSGGQGGSTFPNGFESTYQKLGGKDSINDLYSSKGSIE